MQRHPWYTKEHFLNYNLTDKYNYQEMLMDLNVKLGWNHVAINFHLGDKNPNLQVSGFATHQDQYKS